MGQGELGVLCVLVLLAFPLQRLALTGQDLIGLIRSAIGDLAAARKQYEVEKGSFAFWLDIKGRDNQSLAMISGEYPLISGYRDQGFLLDTPQGTRSLCRQSDCDWHPEHVVLLRGEPQQSHRLTLKAERASVAQLRDWLRHYAGVEAYLIGEARMAEALIARSLERPPVISALGERLRFDHARLRDLEGIDGPLREIALSVQVRTPPGAQLPPPPKLAAAPVDDLLSHWITGRLGLDAEKPRPVIR